MASFSEIVCSGQNRSRRSLCFYYIHLDRVYILLFFFQSQPCHWRNMKNVKRRSVEEASVAPRLSENISLFQSLRVLQEGEEDETPPSKCYYIIWLIELL